MIALYREKQGFLISRAQPLSRLLAVLSTFIDCNSVSNCQLLL